MVGAGSQKLDNLDAGDIELDFDDGQYISCEKFIGFELIKWLPFLNKKRHQHILLSTSVTNIHTAPYITSFFHNLSL